MTSHCLWKHGLLKVRLDEFSWKRTMENHENSFASSYPLHSTFFLKSILQIIKTNVQKTIKKGREKPLVEPFLFLVEKILL